MTTDQQPAVLVHDGPAPAIRFERTFTRPPERVWQALVDKDDLAHWMPAWLDGDLHEGARIRVPFFPEVVAAYGLERPVVDGEIRRWAPPHVLEWVWGTDVVRHDLEPADGGTRLTVTVRPDPAGPPLYLTASGHHVCLVHLAQLLDTGDAPSVVTTDPAPYQAIYRQAWGA